MKVTTERLPNSTLALDIELDQDQVDKGLNRAAQRISQKYTIPGFRKGKAPRFIIENYLGRETVLEEATSDLINRALKQVVKEQEIVPAGQPSVESIETEEAFRFRVTIPLPPTVTLNNYRDIRVPLEEKPVTDQMRQHALDMIREKHVVLRELEEMRPAKEGDQLTLKQEVFVDGKHVEEDEDKQVTTTNAVLEPNRLLEGLFEGLNGIEINEVREITVSMPEDHENEQVRGKEVTFKFELTGIQERVLPDWDEVPRLEDESFEGTTDEWRQTVYQGLEDSARAAAENGVIDGFLEQLLDKADFDIAEASVRSMAEDMMQEQTQKLQRFGVTIEQFLQYQGKTQEDFIDEIRPEAERRLKISLAMMNVASEEALDITAEDIDKKAGQLIRENNLEEVEDARQILMSEYREQVVQSALDDKIRERIVAIAIGEAPELPAEEAVEADTVETSDVASES